MLRVEETAKDIIWTMPNNRAVTQCQRLSDLVFPDIGRHKPTLRTKRIQTEKRVTLIDFTQMFNGMDRQILRDV